MTKVKICGLSRVEDIDAVNSALPDYIGFVFAQSSRRIDEATAMMLKERLDLQIKSVGVFVNEDAENVAALCNCGVIDFAQLHGDEDEDYIARLKDRCGCPVIKAIGIGDELMTYPCNADYLLFDTLSHKRGGSGAAFNWSLLAGFSGKPFFIAGGLSAHNVSEVIITLAPFGVDVSSGVETNGKKDVEKIYEFISIVRQT